MSFILTRIRPSTDFFLPSLLLLICFFFFSIYGLEFISLISLFVWARLAQLVSVLGQWSKGRWFETRIMGWDLVEWLERCASIPMITTSNPSSGSEFTFRSDLVLTARGGSTWALLVEFACLPCYPGNTLCFQRLEPPGRVGIGALQNPKFILFYFILYGEGIWPNGQSGGLARRRSSFDPLQGQPLYIWMYTPSAVSIFGWICALYKSSYFIFISFIDIYIDQLIILKKNHNSSSSTSLIKSILTIALHLLRA
jgi:hypothetical protein